MKRLLLAALMAAVAITPAFAVQIRIVSPYRASQFQGSVMAVHGRAEVRHNMQMQGTDVRLIAPDGRVEFIGFIPKLNEYEFPNIQSLDGKEVVMYGVMEIYRGLPATQLIFNDQVQSWPIVPRRT